MRTSRFEASVPALIIFPPKLEFLGFFYYYHWGKYSCNPLKFQYIQLFWLHFSSFSFLFWKIEKKLACGVLGLFHSISGAGAKGADKIETWTYFELIFTFIVTNSDNTCVWNRKWRSYLSPMSLPPDNIDYFLLFLTLYGIVKCLCS